MMRWPWVLVLAILVVVVGSFYLTWRVLEGKADPDLEPGKMYEETDDEPVDLLPTTPFRATTTDSGVPHESGTYMYRMTKTPVDESVEIIDNRIYDAQTGREMTVEEAMEDDKRLNQADKK